MELTKATPMYQCITVYKLLVSQAIRKYLDDLRVEVEQLEVGLKKEIFRCASGKAFVVELHIGAAIGD